MHIPGVKFVALGGYHLIGLEIDDIRCALAADFLHGMVNCYPRAKIALFNHDVVEYGNWSKVVVFFFWDQVGVTPDLLSLCHSSNALTTSQLLIPPFMFRCSPTKPPRDFMKMFIGL